VYRSKKFGLAMPKLVNSLKKAYGPRNRGVMKMLHAEIKEGLEEGFTRHEIWELLRKSNNLSMSYRAFCRWLEHLEKQDPGFTPEVRVSSARGEVSGSVSKAKQREHPQGPARETDIPTFRLRHVDTEDLV
jgi:hypothetical protein